MARNSHVEAGLTHPLQLRLGLSKGVTLLALVALSCSVARDQPFRNEKRWAMRARNAGTETPRSLRAAYLASRQAEAGVGYRFQTDGAEIRGTNPEQGFSLDVSTRGVTVRADHAAPQLLNLRFSGFGCAGSVEGTWRAAPVASDNRVSFAHRVGDVDIEEWYTNGPLGIEQGFTVAHGPRCAERSELVFDVSTSGDVEPRLDQDRSVTFLTRWGTPVHRYTDLYAVDARGRELASRVQLTPSGVRLVVDAREATYPIVVDPLLSLQQKLTASDGAKSDSFGVSVSISGDTAVVGAAAGFVEHGSAYVFVRSGATWSQQQKLTAPGGAAGDFFGDSVAVSGDTVVIGATGIDVGPTSDQGGAYVFVRSGTIWALQQKLVASDGAKDDRLGRPLAISGDTVVAGAPFADVGPNVDQGSAYVFVRSGTVWSQQQKLTATGGTGTAFFGLAVSAAGDTALIGAPGEGTSYPKLAPGSAYVFTRNGATWSQQQKLTASDGAASDYFGWSVSVSGDTAVIGSPYDEIGFNYSNQGSAYVFVRSGGTWSEQQKLTAGTTDRFGGAVSLSGNAVVISAHGSEFGSNYKGVAYVFARSGGFWALHQKLVAPDAAAFDYFGSSVSLSGDTAVIAAVGDDIGSNSDQGSAYTFAAVVPACTSGSDCTTGFCVDGVCCDTACGGGDPGDCQACSQVAGASANGTCGWRADASVCDDGVYCNGADSCQAGVCAKHTGDPCMQGANDGDFDCSESCDESAHACVGDNPDGTWCDDGIACNGGDSCTSGTCSAHTTVCGAGGTGSTSGSGGSGGAGGSSASGSGGAGGSSASGSGGTGVGGSGGIGAADAGGSAGMSSAGSANGGSGAGGVGAGGVGAGGSGPGGSNAGGTGGPSVAAREAGDDGDCGCKLAASNRSRVGSTTAAILFFVLARRRRRRSSSFPRPPADCERPDQHRGEPLAVASQIANPWSTTSRASTCWTAASSRPASR